MLNAISVSRATLAVAVLVVVGAVGAVWGFFRAGGDESVIPIENTSTYTEAVAGSWQRVNPLYTTENEVDADLARLVFSGLVRLGPDGVVLPDLAALPEITDSGRTYAFTLADDTYWHDGAPVTSGDVAFTVEQIQSPDFAGSPELAATWANVTVETPDADTVVFRLAEPYAPFLARNATLGLLPRHLLVGDGAPALYDSPFNAQPVGTGPYRLMSLNSQEARLEAYDEYHLGRPRIDVFTFRFYTDYPTAMGAMETGDVDGLFIRDGASPEDRLRLEELGSYSVETPSRASYIAMYLNNGQASFFENELVRTAVSLAVDRDAIAEQVFGGMAIPSSSVIAPGSWAYNPDGDTFETDLQRAADLLSEAGWVKGVTSGVLTRDGVEFRITVRTDNDATRRALAEEIARELEPLGIRATVASTTFAVLRRDFLDHRRYDAAIAGWDQGADPDPYSAWHSSQAGPGNRNIADYADIVADDLIAQGRTSPDPAIRADAYRQLQDIWADETPSVIIGYPTSLYARSDSVSHGEVGVLFRPGDRFHDVHEWTK